MSPTRILAGAAAYLAVSFPLAFVWHLVAFRSIYDQLGYFGDREPVLALGFLSIAAQGLILSALYPRFYRGGHPAREGLRFGLIAGLFLWTSHVVATAAKHIAHSLPAWFAIESVYLALQFALVGVAIGLAHGRVGAGACPTTT